MFRWLILILIMMVLLQYFEPWLKRLRFGKLPGDLTFFLFGRIWYLPITSVILLYLAFELLSRLL